MKTESYLMAEDPHIDLEIAEALADELEDYIVGDELYRTVLTRTSAGDRNMNMSGVDLLARLDRLQGERDTLSAEERKRLDELQQHTDVTIYSLRSRFNERLNREFKARLDALRYFLKECAEDHNRCRVEYPFEMRNRQRIEVILKTLGNDASPGLLTALQQVDRRILQTTRDGPFVWDSRLESVYAPDPYWYLYRGP